MAFDFKKEFKELYMPPKTPRVVDVPSMRYIAVYGHGDPNNEDSEYKHSIELLYAVAFTIKMSKMGTFSIDGYFDFVVPPLEGFWSQAGNTGPMDYTKKDDFNFISCIRMPDFVTKDVFEWAVSEATKKKGIDLSKVTLIEMNEGTCIQCMHIGSYDTEPTTIETMMDYAASQGYEPDITDERLHHEVYLSDPRKCAPERIRTVIRIPVKRTCD